MNVSLVAGGAGFIGSHLCDNLLRLDHSVICIDSFITGDAKNIEEYKNNPRFTSFQYDITKELTDIVQKVPKITHIFHLASPASPNTKSPRSYINHPIETLLANSLGTQNLLELAKKIGAKFLYASSSEIYGDPEKSPQKENYFGNVNPVGPRSVYDEAKRFGEAMTMAYVRTFGLDARIIRIFNTYGEKMQEDDGRVISNFIVQALRGDAITVYGTGAQTRSFCYISDMVDGIIKAIETSGTKEKVINLGNPREQTILELATIIKDMTGSSSSIVYENMPEDDPKRRKPDIDLAKTLLSWEPQVDLEEGLQKTIDFFKNRQ